MNKGNGGGKLSRGWGTKPSPGIQNQTNVSVLKKPQTIRVLKRIGELQPRHNKVSRNRRLNLSKDLDKINNTSGDLLIVTI